MLLCTECTKIKKFSCAECTKIYNKEYKDKNKETVKENYKKWQQKNKEYCRQKNKEQFKKKKVLGLCTRCGRKNDRNFNECSDCGEKRKRVSEKLKLEVFSYYGQKCCLCSNEDLDVLSIDHIKNDGKKHREKISQHLYSWLKKYNYPEGFQCLCYNCNWKKHIKNRNLGKKETEHIKHKKQVLEHYGYCCTCCPCDDPEVLTIDHIKNDGNKHRKVINAGHFYLWLIKNNFPVEFQTLCRNCNRKKYLQWKVQNASI